MKKALILFLSISFLFSCDKDEIGTTEETVVIFKKINTNSGLNRNSEFEDIEVVVTSFDPLVIESNEMEVITGNSTETENLLQITSFFDANYNTNETESRNALPRERSGWLYNGGTDCFYYGTYTYHDNGTVTFTYADTATQILMNVCGGRSDPYIESGFARTSN